MSNINNNLSNDHHLDSVNHLDHSQENDIRFATESRVWFKSKCELINKAHVALATVILLSTFINLCLFFLQKTSDPVYFSESPGINLTPIKPIKH